MPTQTEKRPMQVDDFYKIVYLEDPQISPDANWIAYVQVTIDKLENTYKRNIWLAPTDGGKPIQLTRGGKDSQPRWSPNGEMLAFTSGRDDKPQIYLLRVAVPGGDPRPLTNMANGASSPRWSPDGTLIAFNAGLNTEERSKEGEEDEPPKNKFEAKQRKELKEEQERLRFDPRWVQQIPYREGTSYRDDRYQQVYVMPVAEDLPKEEAKPRRLTDLDTHYGEPEWAPDGKWIVVARSDDPIGDEPWRHQNLYRLNLEAGTEEPLTVNDGFSDFAPLVSPDGKWIAYSRSPRVAFTMKLPRLSVMPIEGGEPRDLNLEFDHAPTNFLWSKDSQWIYFTAPNEGRTEIYRVNPDGGEVETVVPGRMEVEAFDLADDASIAFVATTPMSPPELFWQPHGADEPLQLTDVNKPFLDEVIVQPTYDLSVTSPDGQPIQAWYILPVGFEEGKQYPMIFQIHGGPHAMWSPSTKTMWHEWQYQAASGYVVLYSNPRGSDGYGEDFQAAILGKMAEPAYTDLMAVVDTMLEQGFVDESHMAVTGGSYGGLMTAWVVSHTDRFACALSARGVYNFMSFNGTTDIPAFNTDKMGVELWEDPMLLWEWSPLAHAHKIKTPLLIKHAENDFRVPIEQAEQLYATARRAGAPVEFIRYPREGHELSRSGEPEHRLSRYNVMMEWFDRYCEPEQAEQPAE